MKRVIHDYGSTSRLVIPGDFPFGCFPVYLAAFETDDPFANDENQCIKNRNEIAAYHNYLVQQAIEELKQEFLNATIVYGITIILSCGYFKMPKVLVCLSMIIHHHHMSIN